MHTADTHTHDTTLAVRDPQRTQTARGERRFIKKSFTSDSWGLWGGCKECCVWVEPLESRGG